MYEAFIRDLDARLTTSGFSVLWFHWPDDPGFGRYVPGATAVLPQRGLDLGGRMMAAFEEAFACGYAPVVMIGADVPHVELDGIRLAAERLASGADIVVGPARDGGYCLMGLGGSTPGVFEGIPWGSSRVYEMTMQRIAALGLQVDTLPVSFDVDEAADLDRLAGVLEEDAAALPRTRALLAEMGLLAPGSANGRARRRGG